MGADKIFLDTNVLVYANIKSAPLHGVALQAIIDHYNAGSELWISRQVIREYLATLTKPQQFSYPPSTTTLQSDIIYFQSRFSTAEENQSVTDKLLDLLRSIKFGGKQVHDANIVATMLVHNITHLLTHNTADFARFGTLITIVPLIT